MKNSSYRNLKRINNTKKYKDKLKRLETYCWFPSPVYWKEKDGKRFLKRYYRSTCAKFIKRQASKAARRYRDELSYGSSYKKTYDFWWTLF